MDVKVVSLGIICVLCNKLISASMLSEDHISTIYNEHENNSAVRCILKVMKNQIPCHTVVTMIYSPEDINYLIETISKSECYTLAIRSFKDLNWPVKTSAYVIITEDLEELADGISLITTHSFWNPRARIICHIHDIQYNEINEVFSLFIKYRTYDVIFLTNNEQNAEVFTYYPFEDGYCGKKFDNAQLISYCSNFSSADDFFPNKYKNRMKNCTIRVLVSEDIPNIIIATVNNVTKVRGFEGFIIENTARREHLNIEYTIATKKNLGAVLPNHKATGLLASLQSNEADIAAGGFVLIKNRADIFEVVYGYNFATFNLYTAANRDPVWIRLDIEFDVQTWILIIVSFCVITIVLIAFVRFSKIIYSASDIILNIWAILYLSNGSKSLFNITKLRLIVTSWVWFSFFVSSFYTTALYSYMTAFVIPVRHISPDNLNSLPLKPCVSDHIREHFKYAYNQTLPQNARIANCSYSETTLDTVASRTDLYAVEMTYNYDIRRSRFIDEKGFPKLDAWSFPAVNVLAIHVSRGFPLTNKFQLLALRLYEGGFLKHYADEILHKSNAVISKPKIYRNIRLGDLKVHFLVLLTGTIISTLCLFAELCIQIKKLNYLKLLRK